MAEVRILASTYRQALYRILYTMFYGYKNSKKEMEQI